MKKGRWLTFWVAAEELLMVVWLGILSAANEPTLKDEVIAVLNAMMWAAIAWLESG